VAKQLKSIIILAVMVSLLMTACSQPLQETTSMTKLESGSTSSSTLVISEPIDYTVTADSFSLEESADGVGSILLGELTSGVTVNARVYCEKDLSDPGMGSVDAARYKVFLPSDIDLLVSPKWTVTSDETSNKFFNGIDAYNQRIAEYTDEADNRISIFNAYNNFFYTVQFGKSDLLSLIQSYDRIPWFSTDLAWGTEEFVFGTGEEAFAELKDYAERLGVTISSVYKIEYVTPAVFETMYRLQLADGSDGWPEKTWSEKDSAYWIEAMQEWNGLPINYGDFGKTYDGTNLDGVDFHNTSRSQVSFLQTAAGVQKLQILNAFQPLEKGAEKKLISLWDALQALKVHMENPEYEMEVLYRLPEKDVLIDRIELCYLPINQATVNTENPGTGFTEGLLDTENGGKTFLFQMTPCWTFRVIWNEGGMDISEYCAVNAISGEYILSTDYFPGI
jgi:hypothetical protein